MFVPNGAARKQRPNEVNANAISRGSGSGFGYSRFWIRDHGQGHHLSGASWVAIKPIRGESCVSGEMGISVVLRLRTLFCMGSSLFSFVLAF